jgi:hypothetical protein
MIEDERAEPVLRRGDFVTLTMEPGDAIGRYEVEGMVVIASENSKSAMVMFDGLFGGYLGMVPLLWQDGSYRDLIRNREVQVAVRPRA